MSLCVSLSEEQIVFVRELEDVHLSALPGTVSFECEVSRLRVPVQWYRNDEALAKGGKYDMESEGRTHRLIVREADGQDEAKYTVVAKNNRSSASLTIHGQLATCYSLSSFPLMTIMHL